MTAYDEATRTFIADSDKIGLGNQTPGYDINPDGSVDVYFGPTEPYFDKTWVLPNIELLE